MSSTTCPHCGATIVTPPSPDGVNVCARCQATFSDLPPGSSERPPSPPEIPSAASEQTPSGMPAIHVAAPRSVGQSVRRQRQSSFGWLSWLGCSLVLAVGGLAYLIANREAPEPQGANAAASSAAGVVDSLVATISGDRRIVQRLLENEFSEQNLNITDWAPIEKRLRAKIKRGDGELIEMIVESRAEAEQIAVDAPQPQQPCSVVSVDTFSVVTVKFTRTLPTGQPYFGKRVYYVIDGEARARQKVDSGVPIAD